MEQWLGCEGVAAGVLKSRCSTWSSMLAIRSIWFGHGHLLPSHSVSFTAPTLLFYAPPLQVRPGHDQVHLLRLLPGGLPRGRNCGGTQVRARGTLGGALWVPAAAAAPWTLRGGPQREAACICKSVGVLNVSIVCVQVSCQKACPVDTLMSGPN